MSQITSLLPAIPHCSAKFDSFSTCLAFSLHKACFAARMELSYQMIVRSNWAKLYFVSVTPLTRQGWQGTMSDATSRTEIEANRKRKAEADREVNRLKRQKGEVLRECGSEARRLRSSTGINAFAFSTLKKCLCVLGPWVSCVDNCRK